MNVGWTIQKLKDVCEIISGTTPSTKKDVYWNGNLNWITPAEIDNDNTYISSSVRKITPQAVNDCSLRLMPPGTVIFTSRAPIGKVAIAEMSFYCNQGFKNLICKKGLYNKFLYYWLKDNTEYLNSLGKGTTFKEISKTILESVEISHPSFAEQKRIVGILDRAFEKIDAIRRNAEESLKHAKELYQRALKDELTPSSKWKSSTLGILCSKIGSGATPRGGKNSYHTEGVSLIRSMNVYNNDFHYAELAHLDDKQALELKNVSLCSGDVLINITGASIARCCIVPDDILPARVNQHVSILRLNTSEINRQFLVYYLVSSPVQKVLLGIGAGGSTRQALTKQDLTDFQISYPNKTIQLKIISKLDSLSALCTRLEQNCQQITAFCEEMKKAVLAKAFRGEL